MSRAGFALSGVIWILSGISIVAFAAGTVAHSAVTASGNRNAAIRAEWRAEGCLATLRAAMARVTANAQFGFGPAISPLELRDRSIADPAVQSCPGAVTLRPSGTTLDLNAAEPRLLLRALLAHGIPPKTADSLVDALADWTDADDEPRAHGAERTWYEARGERPPRNGPLEAFNELRLIRGFERWMGPYDTREGLAELLSIDEGRVVVGAAPEPVLRALPGITAEAARTIVSRRSALSADATDPLALLALLQGEERDSLHASIGAFQTAATLSVDRWILRASSSGMPNDALANALTVTVELHLVRDGDQLVVAERRIWR